MLLGGSEIGGCILMAVRVHCASISQASTTDFEVSQFSSPRNATLFVQPRQIFN